MQSVDFQCSCFDLFFDRGTEGGNPLNGNDGGGFDVGGVRLVEVCLGGVDLDVELPNYWWVTDLSYRNWTVDPRVYFSSEPLSTEEKAALDLEPDGFASRVNYIDRVAKLLSNHTLVVGDIVYGVDGDTRDDIANTADLFLKLRRQAGGRYTLKVIRGDERIDMPLKTDRMSFRK